MIIIGLFNIPVLKVFKLVIYSEIRVMPLRVNFSLFYCITNGTAALPYMLAVREFADALKLRKFGEAIYQVIFKIERSSISFKGRKAGRISNISAKAVAKELAVPCSVAATTKLFANLSRGE